MISGKVILIGSTSACFGQHEYIQTDYCDRFITMATYEAQTCFRLYSSALLVLTDHSSIP